MVSAGPVAGDYINTSLEEGFGNWFEIGYIWASHTDGGNPDFSPVFNYAGMNIFSVKANVVAEKSHHRSWFPALPVGGAVRTNDPCVSQTFAKTNATIGDNRWGRTRLSSSIRSCLCCSAEARVESMRRLSRYPGPKWSVDIGTGHIATSVAPGIDLKINNAIALTF
jgi:hypothetical protein